MPEQRLSRSPVLCTPSTSPSLLSLGWGSSPYPVFKALSSPQLHLAMPTNAEMGPWGTVKLGNRGVGQGAEMRGGEEAAGQAGPHVHPSSLAGELQASGTAPGPSTPVSSAPGSHSAAPKAQAAMDPGEKLDPLPDSFILQPPVFYPVVPYVTTIFGGLHAGKMVMLQGTVPLDAHRFQVDFQCGCSLNPQPDIIIHFNPRFHTSRPHVICNTLHRGHWQTEARWPGLALQRGTGFLILFLFGNEEVKVSVNGQHFLHYRYRLPLSRVDTLGIFGDILVQTVGFLNISPFAEGSREYPAGHVSQPFLLQSPRLELPCSRTLSRGLWPGQVIIVRGLVLQEPKHFTLSLRDEAARIPVMLRVSFSDYTLSWVSPWGSKTLIAAPFLFYPQRFFEVLLLCQEGGLKLALNGQSLGATSLGQQALERLRELQVSGNIQLYCVHC
ncbi:galectin-12 isoform X4 [Fukomys damarensis]|uniref:galectin-12 isoform X4 n=1 Tax=Fukomys damarensis TaxID=885580 RepID=UPI0005400A19|nr:galectin-12 isoform X4 [Fukomys damarensis]